jgi:uncharacterized protein (DUF2147 family)
MRTGNVGRFAGVVLIPFACALSASARPAAPLPVAAEGASRGEFPPDAIVGEWWTEREERRPSAKVRLSRAKDGTYTGVLVWSPKPTKDIHNEDPKRRDRSVVGIVLMWNLRYDDGEYGNGYVYNPEDGGTYRMKARMESADRLLVRGYLGIALFGQTQTWTRVRAR